MRLGLRRRRTPIDGEASDEQRTLALPYVLEWLRRRKNAKVLDLGGAHGGNVAFLARYGCRLEILDLFARLGEVGESGGSRMARPGAAALDSLVDEALAAGTSAPGEQLDLVLAWDLCDYLALDQVGALYRGMRRYLAPGCRMLAAISYVGNVPLHPRRWRIAAEDRLAWDREAPRVRPSPRYTEPQLLKRLPDMSVDRSFLLRQGYRELVLRYGAG